MGLEMYRLQNRGELAMSIWRELKMTILTYPRECGCIWTRARDFIFYCDEHATDEDKKKISADYSWKFGEIVSE